MLGQMTVGSLSALGMRRYEESIAVGEAGHKMAR